MPDFTDRYILVTGASSGIGLATSKAIVSRGGRVIMVSRDKKRLLEAANQLPIPSQARIYPIDLADFDAYKDFYGFLSDEGITLDGMVHCAGNMKVLPLRTISYSSLLDVFNIHFFSFIELTKYFSRQSIGGGSIVAISSINAHVPDKCMTAYACAKAAVEAACRTLCIELADKSIRINSIVVGGMGTPMQSMPADLANNTGKDQRSRNFRRLLHSASPETIAESVIFLLGEGSSHMTGRELYADGGLF